MSGVPTPLAVASRASAVFLFKIPEVLIESLDKA